MYRYISADKIAAAQAEADALKDRTIIVRMVDHSVTGSTILPIPQDEDSPEFQAAQMQFAQFYHSVLKYMKSVGEIEIQHRGSSSSHASISAYIRFTVEEKVTGSVLQCMFELQVSNHLLPSIYDIFSLDQLMYQIKEHESKTCDVLEPQHNRFIVNENTDESYDDALGRVIRILNLVIQTGEFPED